MAKFEDRAVATRRKRMLDGAALYAAGDRSDPFTFGRAMAHIRSGIAGITQGGEDAFYKAEPHQEERFLPNGVSYFATVYRAMQRP